MTKNEIKGDVVHDPHAKRKKKTITAIILILGVLVIVSFSIFGKLLSDYLVFDATRIEAARELEAIKSRFNEQEEQLSFRNDDFETPINAKKKRLEQLDNNISVRESKIASQQKLIDEVATLTETISSTKDEYQLTFKNLEVVRKDMASQVSIASAVHFELQSLTAQKKSLQDDILKYDKSKDESEQAHQNLITVIRNLEQTKSTVENDISELQQSSERNSNILSKINIEIENTRQVTNQVEDDIAKQKAVHALVTSQIIFANESVDSKNAEKKEMELQGF